MNQNPKSWVVETRFPGAEFNPISELDFLFIVDKEQLPLNPARYWRLGERQMKIRSLTECMKYIRSMDMCSLCREQDIDCTHRVSVLEQEFYQYRNVFSKKVLPGILT